MVNTIHPQAIVGKRVKLGTGNGIGPNVVIEDGVSLGDHNTVSAGAYLCRGTTIGNQNEIHMGAIIGHAPQDVAYKGAPTFTCIGDRNIIREYVTIHRGTKERTSTIIGNDNLFMVNSHVAHNCIVGNRVTLVNVASLTGYCEIEDDAFLSGMTGLHQFTRVGRLVMLSALSAVNKDIPPYMICGGRPAVVIGVNVVGLKRHGISPEGRSDIREAYKVLYRSGLNVSQALAVLARNDSSQEVKHLIQFIKDSKRGICAGGDGGSETIRHRKYFINNSLSSNPTSLRS